MLRCVWILLDELCILRVRIFLLMSGSRMGHARSGLITSKRFWMCGTVFRCSFVKVCLCYDDFCLWHYLWAVLYGTERVSNGDGGFSGILGTEEATVRGTKKMTR